MCVGVKERKRKLSVFITALWIFTLIYTCIEISDNGPEFFWRKFKVFIENDLFLRSNVLVVIGLIILGKL